MNDDTWWCRFKGYLLNVALISTLYSNTFQALHRFFRIIYPNRRFLYTKISSYIIGILIQAFLSVLQPLPILLIGEFQYEDYHCQVPLTSGRGVTMGLFFVWVLPVSITIMIYAYTVHYIGRNSSSFTAQRQRNIKRDFIVIKRILWLIIFILVCGIPASCTSIVYFLVGYIAWWANHLAFSTFLISFVGMSIVQTCFSPHIRTLWSRSHNEITPATAMSVRNFT